MSDFFPFFSLPKEVHYMILCQTTLLPQPCGFNDGSLSVQNGRFIRDANHCCRTCKPINSRHCHCRSRTPPLPLCTCTAFPLELLSVSRAFTNEVYEVFLQHNRLYFSESLYATFDYLSKSSPYFLSRIRDLVIEVPTHSWTISDTEIWEKLVAFLGSSLDVKQVRLTLDAAGLGMQIDGTEPERQAWEKAVDTIVVKGGFSNLRGFYCLMHYRTNDGLGEIEAKLGQKVLGERWDENGQERAFTRKRQPDWFGDSFCCIEENFDDSFDLSFEGLGPYGRFDGVES